MANEPLDVTNDFDAWAAVSAKLMQRTPAEVEYLLASLGVAAAWPAANDAWSRTLAHDLMKNQLERARRYAEKCHQELDRRRNGVVADRMEITELNGIRPPQASYGDFRELAISPAPVSQGREMLGETLDRAPTARMQARHMSTMLGAGAAASASTPPSGVVTSGVVTSAPAQPTFVESPSAVARVPPSSIPALPEPGPNETRLERPNEGVRNALRDAELVSQWTVEQWACFCAEIAENPDAAELNYARHGLQRDVARRHVHSRWEERFQQDPALFAHYQALVQQERANIAARRQ